MNLHPFAVVGLALVMAATPTPTQFVPNHLYVSLSGVDQVGQFDAELRKVNLLASGSGVDDPTDLAFGPNGHLYVSSSLTNRVLEIDVNGTIVSEIGVGSGLSFPQGIAFGSDGHLFVSSFDTDRVFEFDHQGAVVRQLGAGSPLDGPMGIAVGAAGHVYVASSLTDSVVELDASGMEIHEIEHPSLDDPADVAFGPNGRLYVVSRGTDRVVSFDGDGNHVGEISGGLDEPYGIAFGPDGNVYVASAGNDKIAKFSASGEPIAELVSSGLGTPTALAFAPFRFKASIRASVSQPGVVPKTVSEKNAVVSFAPGSRTLMLEMPDNTKNANDYFSLFGTPYAVLPGFDGTSSETAKKRLFVGSQVPEAPTDNGVGSVNVALTGKVGTFGEYVVSNLKGTFGRPLGGIVYSASIRSSKLLK